VRLGEQLREIWRQAAGWPAGRKTDVNAAAEVERKTLALPMIASPVQFPGPYAQADADDLRRFAETPVVRRAINVIKDRIASMDWQVRVRRGVQAGLLTDVQNKLRRYGGPWKNPIQWTAFAP